VWTIVTIVAVALALTGCVGNPVFYDPAPPEPRPTRTIEPSNIAPSDVPEGSQNSDGVREDYAIEASSWPLALPDGVDFPDDIPMKVSPDELYQYGVAQGAVAEYWRCAWFTAYFENVADNDPVEEERILSNLELWSTTQYYRDFVVEDPAASFQSEIIDKTRAGDPSTLIQFAWSC